MTIEVVIQHPILSDAFLVNNPDIATTGVDGTTIEVEVRDEPLHSVRPLEIVITDDHDLSCLSTTVSFGADTVEVVWAEGLDTTAGTILIDTITLVEEGETIEVVSEVDFLGNTLSGGVEIVVQEEFLGQAALAETTNVIVGVSMGEYLAAAASNVSFVAPAGTAFGSPTNAQTALSALFNNSYSTSEVDGLISNLSLEYLPITWTPTWSQVQHKPTEFTPEAHSHTYLEVDSYHGNFGNSWTSFGEGIVFSPITAALGGGVVNGVQLSGYDLDSGTGFQIGLGNGTAAFRQSGDSTWYSLATLDDLANISLADYLPVAGGSMSGDLTAPGITASSFIGLSSTAESTHNFIFNRPNNSAVTNSVATSAQRPITLSNGTTNGEIFEAWMPLSGNSGGYLNFFLTPTINGVNIVTSDDLPDLTNYVTTNTVQTITAGKTFSDKTNFAGSVYMESGHTMFFKPAPAVVDPNYSREGKIYNFADSGRSSLLVEGDYSVRMATFTGLGGLSIFDGLAAFNLNGASDVFEVRPGRIELLNGASDIIIDNASGLLGTKTNGQALTIRAGTTDAQILMDSLEIRLDTPLTYLTGDLYVAGTTTTVNSEQLAIADNIITLNSDFTTGTPVENGGIEVLRGDASTALLQWNESVDQWEIGVAGSLSEVITADSLLDYARLSIDNEFLGTNSFRGGVEIGSDATNHPRVTASTTTNIFALAPRNPANDDWLWDKEFGYDAVTSKWFFETDVLVNGFNALNELSGIRVADVSLDSVTATPTGTWGVPGISLGTNTTGSTGFPTEGGLTYNFCSGNGAGASSYGRMFSLYKPSAVDQLHFRGLDAAGTPGNWNRIYMDNYHPEADKLTTPRTISLSGDATGSVQFDGSSNVDIAVTVSGGGGGSADLTDVVVLQNPTLEMFQRNKLVGTGVTHMAVNTTERSYVNKTGFTKTNPAGNIPELADGFEILASASGEIVNVDVSDGNMIDFTQDYSIVVRFKTGQTLDTVFRRVINLEESCRIYAKDDGGGTILRFVVKKSDDSYEGLDLAPLGTNINTLATYVITYDSGTNTWTTYRDGTQVDTETGGLAPRHNVAQNEPGILGLAQTSTGTATLDCVFRHLAFYDSVLSADAISAL